MAIERKACRAPCPRLRPLLSNRRPPATARDGSEASWRSGYAEDCKSLHPGSIPGEASKDLPAAHRILLTSDLDETVGPARRLLDLCCHIVDGDAPGGAALISADMRVPVHDGGDGEAVDRFGQT